jgi:hypothetical protein
MGVITDGGRDDFEVLGHGVAVGPRHDQASGLAIVWTDGTKQPHRCCALIFGCAGPRAPLGPTPCQLGLLSDASFVLEPDF